MKKIFFFLLLLNLSITSFSQQTKSSPTLTKQDYLKKSKGQNSTAWLLMVGGISVLGVTMIVEATSVCIGGGCQKKTFPIIPVGIGIAGIAGSVPFFIVSAKNKRRAMSISFKTEKAPLLQKSSLINESVPSLTLKISL